MFAMYVQNSVHKPQNYPSKSSFKQIICSLVFSIFIFFCMIVLFRRFIFSFFARREIIVIELQLSAMHALARIVNFKQTFPSEKNNVSKSHDDISASCHVAGTMSLI